MSKISTHLNRIRAGGLSSFSSRLHELEVGSRIEVMLEVMLLNAKVSERIVQIRARRFSASQTSLPALARR